MKKRSALQKWIAETGVNESSRLLGCDPSHTSLLKNGLRLPSPKLSRKIAKLTGIPLVELREDIWGEL